MPWYFFPHAHSPYCTSSPSSHSPASPGLASVSLASVKMYTDGACKGNPGPGGWGAYLQSEGYEKELCGGEPHTTNNRMELLAVIEGLSALKKRCSVDVFTDSQYVRQGMLEWLPKWKLNGWKTASKAPVKNADLWQALDEARTRHVVRWHWVKGHSGNPGNEKADALANQGIEKALSGLPL